MEVLLVKEEKGSSPSSSTDGEASARFRMKEAAIWVRARWGERRGALSLVAAPLPNGGRLRNWLPKLVGMAGLSICTHPPHCCNHDHYQAKVRAILSPSPSSSLLCRSLSGMEW